MKTTWILITAVFLGALSLFATEPINWLSDYDSALVEAKKQNKPIFMIYMNSHSCAPCKRLDQNVLTSPEFKAFVDTSLVPLKIDYGPAFNNPPGKRGSALGELKKQSKVPRHLKSQGWPYVYLLSPGGKPLFHSLERTYAKAEIFVDKYTKLLPAKTPEAPQTKTNETVTAESSAKATP